MAENEIVKSNRDRYMERIKTRYPDREWADDEAVFGQVNDDYDGYDQELERYRGEAQALSDMFASNPRSAAFLIDWSKGGDPVAELIRKYGDDFKAALDDPAKQEELAAANKEYAERVAQNQAYEEQYKQNIEQTYATIEQVQQQDGLGDDDIDQAMTFLIGVMRDAIVGKFTAESIRMAVKAVNHDGDIALAEQTGEVRGRNSRIREQLRSSSSRGDGTANLAGRNGSGAPRQQRNDIFALAKEAK